MNQIEVNADMSRSIAEIENTQKMCAMLLKAPHYAKLGSEGVFAIVSKARSLNIDPIYALNGGLYYVQGKVGMPAESMAALIREKGHSIIKDAKSNDSVCILHGKRADNGDTWTISFSMEDAKRAGLVKSSYEKYPAAMLYNRAMSFLARQLFADIIKGAGYTLEELKEIAKIEEPSVEVVVEKPKDETVTQEQADELNWILHDCDERYQNQVRKFLRETAQIESFDMLPLALYERVKTAALKKQAENTQPVLQEMIA